MQQFRPWRYRPVFPGAVYPVDRIARYTRGVTTFNIEDWTPALGLESYDPLLWLRADQGLTTGGARQFYSADKTSFQHADNAFFSGGDIDYYLAMWVNPDSLANYRFLANKGRPSSGELEIYATISGQIYFSAGSSTLLSTAAITASKWSFVEFWHDATANTINIRIDNGTPSNTALVGGLSDSANAFSLGGAPAGLDGFTGKISKVCLLKNTAARAVIDSASTRTSMYNLGRGILSGNLDLLLADLGTFTAGVDWDAWNLNETDGTASARSFSGLNDLTPTFGELITNGGFEVAGGGGADIFAGWSENPQGTATISDELVVVDAGSHAAKMTASDGSTNYAELYQSLGTAGHRYSYSLRARNGGSGNAKILLGSTETLTLSASYQTFTGTLTLSGAAFVYLQALELVTVYIDTVSVTAVDIPAADGPSSDIAPDTGSAGTNHGQLIGYADSETARSTDTADGSPNPTVLDQSGNGYHALMTGFATPDTARSAHGLTGVPGQAITFDGSDDYISLSSNSRLSGVAAYTITGRFKQTTIDQNRNLFHYGPVSGDQITIETYADGNIYVVHNNLTQYASFDYSTVVTAGQWHHISVVYDGGLTGNADRLKVYIDGSQVALTFTGTIAATTSVAGSQLNTVGARTAGTLPWLGELADYRIYSTALTAPQIAAIAAGDSGLTGTPVLRYDFNEANTRTLTTIGAGTSLVFDGVDDYVTISGPSHSLNAAMTLSLWFKSTSTSCTIITQTDYPFYLYINASGGLVSYCAGDIHDFGSPSVNNGQWRHACWVYSGTQELLYINGVQIGTAFTTVSPASTGNIILGQNLSAEWFGGNLDDVRIYSTALTAAQVLQLSQGTEATGATPVSKWTFDEETTLSITDGDPIAAWQSLEGSRYQFIQATASKRPVYRASAINGQPGIDFDGIDDLLAKASAFLTGTSGTVVVVYRLDAVPDSYQVIIASADEATANKYLFLLARGNTANNHLGLDWNNGGTSDLLDGNTAVNVDTDYAASFGSNGATSTARLIGTSQTLNADSGANSGNWWDDATGKDNVSIGARKTTSEGSFLSGKICEVQVWPHNFGAESISKETAYILARYGITF